MRRRSEARRAAHSPPASRGSSASASSRASSRSDHAVRVALAFPVGDQIVGSRRVAGIQLEHSRPVAMHALRQPPVRCRAAPRRGCAVRSRARARAPWRARLRGPATARCCGLPRRAVSERTPGLGAPGIEPRGGLEMVERGARVREPLAAESSQPLVQAAGVARVGVCERRLEQSAQRRQVARAFEQRCEAFPGGVAQRRLRDAGERSFERVARARLTVRKLLEQCGPSPSRARPAPGDRPRTPRARRAVRRGPPDRPRRAAPPRGRRAPRSMPACRARISR